MLEIGWTEIFIIAAVAIIVVGPKDLPRMLRQVGQLVGQVRRMAGEFQGQFKEALKEAELDDLKKDFDDVRKGTSMSDIKSSLNPLKDAADDIKSSIEKAGDETSTGNAASSVSDSAKSRPGVSDPTFDAEDEEVSAPSNEPLPSSKTSGQTTNMADSSDPKGEDGPEKPPEKKQAAE